MKRLNWRTLLAVALVVLVAATCLYWFVRFPPKDSSAAAGWAQTLGTIGAIFGAFAISRYQIGKEAIREKIASLDSRIGILEIVLVLTSDMPALIENLSGLMDHETLVVEDLNELELRQAKFAKSAGRLQAVPIFEIGNSQAAFALSDLERVTSELLSRFDSLHRRGLQSSFFAEAKFPELANSVRDAREQIKEVLSGLHRNRDRIEPRVKQSN